MVRVRAEMAGLVRAKGGAGSQEELKQQLDLGRKVGPKWCHGQQELEASRRGDKTKN